MKSKLMVITYAHLVLRGANHAPNYSVSHLEEVMDHMENHHNTKPFVS